MLDRMMLRRQAEEGPDLYWKYVESWSSPADGSTPDDQQCWRSIVGKAAALLSPGVAQMLPVVLLSRQHTAKLEAYRQMTSQLHPGQSAASCCFADVGGRVATSAAEAKRLAADAASAAAPPASQAMLLPFDHVFNPMDLPAAAVAAAAAGATDTETPVHAVLYASPGTSCFAEMHQALKEAVTEARSSARRVVYAHRPRLLAASGGSTSSAGLPPATSCAAMPCATYGAGGPLLLPGYGVEAALKNTEYNAMDDKKAAAAAGGGGKTAAGAAAAGGGAAGDVGDLSLDVKGFKFDVLVARKPQLRQELLTFRDTLLSEVRRSATQ